VPIQEAVTVRFLLLFWLLLFAACTSSKTPSSKQDSLPWFRDVAADTGLHFRHASGATGKFHMPEIMGSGCALLDYDNDGDLDVLLIQGAPEGGSNKLFRNDGNGSHFTDVTLQAGLTRSGYGMGVAIGDINNDGFPDLLLTAFGPNAIYRNNGNGSFTDATAESPDLELRDRWSSSAAFFDYDRDGWLDLVILNYVDYSIRSNKPCYAPTGELDYCTPRVYQPLPAHLFHNEKGRFVEVSAKAGLRAAAGPGLGVVPLDADGDGWLDLFVANDSMANHLWINRHNGTFVESSMQYGLAYGEEGLAKAGMGVAAGDYDGDGDEDLLVLNLMREGATLFRKDGSIGYTDISQASGIHAITLPWTGFGVAWQDFDRDGKLDLFMANGAVTRREEQRGQPYPFAERNLLLHQAADGRFQEVQLPEPQGVSRGAAFGDLDNDGDVDILVNVNNGSARLLRNETPKRNWIAVQLEGPGLGEGAQIELAETGVPIQRRTVRSSGSYLSSNSGPIVFGLRTDGNSVTVTARTIQGAVPDLQKITPNRLLKLRLRP
jgi:hypothetical protein